MSSSGKDDSLNIGTKIAEAIESSLSTFIDRQMHNNNDFIEKPYKYKGERNPQIIDAWVKTIDDYKAYREYTDKETYRMARLLMIDQAKNWLTSYENDDNTTEKWSALKKSIMSNFKPANTIVILRDQLYNLKQTSTISQYIAEFLNIKLNITNIGNDEAIAQFIRGLKDTELKDRIIRLYRDDAAPPMNEAITEANIYESSTLASQSYVTPNNYPGRNTRDIDDPMDLSVMMEQLMSMVSGNTNSQFNSRNSYNPRGTYYSNHRGNYNDNFRGGHNSYRGDRFSTRGSYSNYSGRGGFRSDRGRGAIRGGRSRMTINNEKCLECNRFGHIRAECPSLAPHMSYNMNHNYYYDDYNQASASNSDKVNNIENKRNTSESYALMSPLL